LKARATKVKDLQILLKELEPYVKAPEFLRRGRPFRNFSLRPREVLANWLICAVGNSEDPSAQLSFATDPLGGDGVVVDKFGSVVAATEHVFVPNRKMREPVEKLLLEGGVLHKAAKGNAYASGKHLVVFSEAVGPWRPSRLARRIDGTHSFSAVWVVTLEKGGDAGYVYSVSLLDIGYGQAPIWKVEIGADFQSWTVQRIQ
jgi:hypothetical protein